MSKAVLISIQPKWCELIASGKKTVEVRKTKPKLETPFKCYIYCTEKDYDKIFCIDKFMHKVFLDGNGKQKVIGEFVCRNIDFLSERDLFEGMDEISNSRIEEYSCLSIDELLQYKGKEEEIYGWHISDLVIYDEPIELGETGEFYTWKKCNSCRDTGYESTACCFDLDCKVPAVISRPPQSWCYVEERSNR